MELFLAFAVVILILIFSYALADFVVLHEISKMRKKEEQRKHNMIKRETEKMLQKDSIAEVEKLLGKNWSDFTNDENLFCLAKGISDNIRENNYFSSIGDTSFKMSWQEFKELIKEKGFIPAMEYDIKHDDCIDEYIIYYKPEKGLIITASSYWNKNSVNEGTLYGEIQANDEESSKLIWKWISTGGIIDKENLIFETSQDVRAGLFSKIEMLESFGKFLPKWTNKNRFLWFVDYVETKTNNYDYKKITEEKLLKCPKELQEIIGREIGGN